MLGAGGMLHRGLRAGEPVRLHGRSRARRRPPAARLEQSDRESGLAVQGRRKAVRELAGKWRHGVANADAAEQWHRREVSADRPRDQAQLDRPQVGSGAAEQAEVDEVLPQSGAVRIGGLPGGLGGRPLAIEEGVDRLLDPDLLVAQLEVHDYSFGSERIRSAMMSRWIWRVPP